VQARTGKHNVMRGVVNPPMSTQPVVATRTFARGHDAIAMECTKPRGETGGRRRVAGKRRMAQGNVCGSVKSAMIGFGRRTCQAGCMRPTSVRRAPGVVVWGSATPRVRPGPVLPQRPYLGAGNSR